MIDTTEQIYERAISILKQGGIVAAPTDTVYGLLANATNDLAVKKLYKIKNRSFSKPFVLLVNSIEMAKHLADFSKEAADIAKHFWEFKKKALTVILPVKNASRLITAERSTIAIRIPNHKLSLELIRGLSSPIVATSANLSGKNTSDSFEMVKNDFKDKIPLIIDGGKCKNVASTIVNLSKKPFSIVRQGGITKEELTPFFDY
ncbi:MAG: threonylcarbamoyl-AMP synthase [Holosporales bacterium]|jgi:L-threonylcarbamoyladenylate synthase|nr:threonylcarbamoyl-AMP synthase [Holosporales bacterium]